MSLWNIEFPLPGYLVNGNKYPLRHRSSPHHFDHRDQRQYNRWLHASDHVYNQKSGIKAPSPHFAELSPISLLEGFEKIVAGVGRVRRLRTILLGPKNGRKPYLDTILLGSADGRGHFITTPGPQLYSGHGGTRGIPLDRAQRTSPLRTTPIR